MTSDETPDSTSLPRPLGEEPDPQTDFDLLVAHIAHAAAERDPSSPDSVAARCVECPAGNTDQPQDTVLRTNGEPFVLERITADEILAGADVAPDFERIRDEEANGPHATERVREEAARRVLSDRIREYTDQSASLN